MASGTKLQFSIGQMGVVTAPRYQGYKSRAATIFDIIFSAGFLKDRRKKGLVLENLRDDTTRLSFCIDRQNLESN